MKDQTLEIRVAIIGYVSVGKTTVINALLGDEYGEVAMKRTTAVVNSFRLSSNSTSNETSDNDNAEDNQPDIVNSPDNAVEAPCDVDDGSNNANEKKLSATETLSTTKLDNAKHRNSAQVEETVFDIELATPLHKMRKDTKLVIVDIPGINEAGTSSKYKDYVNQKWHTFDIVVLVMDARQGVNTDEQHDLLALVQQNIDSIRDIPVIILGNKVEDPYRKEQKALLQETRSTIEKLFNIRDCEEATKKLMKVSPVSKKRKTNNTFGTPLFPVFIPISAINAFVYRCGSKLSFDEFCKMDEDFIDQIGRDSYGRQWNRYDKDKQLKMAYEAVSDEEQHQDGLGASNFECFLTVLKYCIGGEEKQIASVRAQVSVALGKMQELQPNMTIASELVAASNRLVALGQSTSDLAAYFWEPYQKLLDSVQNQFMAKKQEKQLDPAGFHRPIVELLDYAKSLKTLHWEGEEAKIVAAAKDLTMKYVLHVVESEVFEEMSLNNKFLIVGCMLLCSGERAFYHHFGSLKLHLESLYMRIGSESKEIKFGSTTRNCPHCSTELVKTTSEFGDNIDHCPSCNWHLIDELRSLCPGCHKLGISSHLFRKESRNGLISKQCKFYCGRSYYFFPEPLPRIHHKMKVENGQLVPVDVAAYKEDVSIVVPDSLEDPKHFGYVVWKCCQLLEETNSSINTSLTNR